MTTEAAEVVPPPPNGSLMLAWQVKDKHVLIVGAGDVALSRIDHLLQANAKITVITGPLVHPRIQAYNELGLFENFLQRDFQMDDIELLKKQGSVSNLEKQLESFKIDDESDNIEKDGLSIEEMIESIRVLEDQKFNMVLTCINDYALSMKIWYRCKILGINVNLADKPKQCDFYFGSVYRNGPLQIMISTNGKSPRLCNRIKNKMLIPMFDKLELDKAVENLNYLRMRLRNEYHVGEDTQTIKERMEWNKKITDFYSIDQWCKINKEKIDQLLELYPNLPEKII